MTVLTRQVQRLLAGVAMVATSAIGNAQAPISIGIVREDGYLMPIAEISEELFKVPLETIVNGEILPPAKPDGQFKDLIWTLVYGRGRPSVRIRTLEPVTIPMPYCSDQIGWRTTLKLPPAPRDVAPIRKIGLAVRGAAVRHPEDVAHQPDAAAGRVARLIVSLVHTKEGERLLEVKGPLGVSSPGDPRQIPVRITLLWRDSFGGVSTYYFEATKPLRVSDGTVIGDAGLVTGWITDSAGKLRGYDVQYKINDDSYKQNDRARVWGIVPYGGRSLWILEWHGWESAYYTVNDWPSGVTRLTVGEYNCGA
jgi:hypothetical protein